MINFQPNPQGIESRLQVTMGNTRDFGSELPIYIAIHLKITADEKYVRLAGGGSDGGVTTPAGL
jgi:hypothetical protein